jgi:hypothetical protein
MGLARRYCPAPIDCVPLLCPSSSALLLLLWLVVVVAAAGGGGVAAHCYQPARFYDAKLKLQSRCLFVRISSCRRASKWTGWRPLSSRPPVSCSLAGLLERPSRLFSEPNGRELAPSGRAQTKPSDYDNDGHDDTSPSGACRGRQRAAGGRARPVRSPFGAFSSRPERSVSVVLMRRRGSIFVSSFAWGPARLELE